MHGIFLFDAIRDSQQVIIDFRLLIINPAAKKLLQLDDSLIGKNIKDIFPIFEENGLFSKYAKVVDHHEKVDMEYFSEMYNKWFHISAANLEDGIVVTFSDINDRKNSEEILRENKLKFEAIFIQSLQFMALLDLEGKYMDVNQTILNLTGRSKEDFLNNDFGFSSSWSLPGEKEKIISAIQKAAQGESIRQQVRIISLEKDIKIIDISIKPFSYKKGEINFIMLEGRDITEIVKANEEIKGKNKLIEGLLENFPIILMKINKKTEISYMSGSGLKVLGYNENEFKGTKYFSSGGR